MVQMEPPGNSAAPSPTASAAARSGSPSRWVPSSEDGPTRSQATAQTAESKLKDVMHERRTYEGGNDGDGSDIEEPGTVTNKMLRKRAEVHMLRTGCTEWDNDQHVYKKQSLCSTKRTDLGRLGVGVQLYFQFICSMGFIFFLLGLLTAPLLVTSILGNMVDNAEGAQKIFGMISAANLGDCGERKVYCNTEEQMRSREAGLNFISPGLRVVDLTQWFGLLDGIGLLIFMFFSLFFRSYWIPREVRINDGRVVTPSDFSLRVIGLPKRLEGDQHKEYEQQLAAHFEKVLRERCGVGEDTRLIHEIVLVRDFDGAINDYICEGQYVVQKRELAVKMANAKNEKSKAKLNTEVMNVNKRIVKLEKSFGANADKALEDRNVCWAFVMFSQDTYMEQLLYEYRFADYRIFRCCQDKNLRFHGKSIRVMRAHEPSDIFWENTDFPKWWRRARKAMTCLMTLIIVLICLAAMLSAKMIGVSGQAVTHEADLWVLKAPTCLSVCDWQLYDDAACRIQAGQVAEVVNVWQPTGLVDISNHSALDACSQDTTLDNGDCDGQWLGLELASSSRVGCMAFQQLPDKALKGIELYACQANQVPKDSLSTWQPNSTCMGLQDLSPATEEIDGWAPSGRQLVRSDTTCAREVSLEAATEALASRMADMKEAGSCGDDSDCRYLASSSDPVVNCFCTQSQTAMGIVTFRTPPYDKDPRKNLCDEWIFYQIRKLVNMGVAVTAVCLFNLVLTTIFLYFVVWERHDTWTKQTTSQFIKLFVAEFLNTALIVLLVNMHAHGLLQEVSVIRILGFGQGSYDDMHADWYTDVGSGICLTMLLQVVSLNLTHLGMAYVFTPLYIWFYTRKAATQRVMNQMYEFPEWDLASRLASTMVFITVVLMYSGGMPILNFIGAVYCFVAYWVDKWCILKCAKKPPVYDAKMLRLALTCMPVAAFLHTVFTLWSFGNQDVFPSNWSEIALKLGEIVIQTEEEYTSTMGEWATASEERRKELFWTKYIWSRALDITRESCWLLMCFFCVFLVYWVLTFLLNLFLAPLLAPLWAWIKDCCSSRKEDEETAIFIDKEHTRMTDSGMLPTYQMHLNPRYSLLLESLHEGRKEIEEAKQAIEKYNQEKEQQQGAKSGAV